ncbi:unnamed protein product [Miscanthus lutarioriparius]|uniref:Uncharacterized protein n=1 Tax=Miscanthus lutarioriparius TaxID=422564 RepID=A0A811SIT5_9POAL|nr:unnamed protein product [Miscanthus lutarioriparius]CAD6342086.1 unnamed protein product [Miscanthus lutarioriparius]
MEWQVVLPDMDWQVVLPWSDRYATGTVVNGFVCWDGKFCVVNVLQCMLSVWLWAGDGGGVGRFMLHKTFSLRANVSEITECSEEADVRMRPMAVINGFVYLSLIIDYYGDPRSPEWFLSFCLETAEVNLLHKESHPIWWSVDPYIMDVETEVTGNISEDDDPMSTEEASPVLFTALQSFKEKLIDDGNLNFAEIEFFVPDDERNSLLS